MLYLAYGSNMSSKRMKERCKSAVKVGIGVLDGYKLVFDGSNKAGSMVADIRIDDKSSVPYVLWEICDCDLYNLDKAEGFPKHYMRHSIFTEKYGMVTVYLMTNLKRNPSKRGKIICEVYLNYIRAGYDENGFDKDIIDEAATKAKFYKEVHHGCCK